MSHGNGQDNGRRNDRNGRNNQGRNGGGRKPRRGGIGLLAIMLGAACWILTIWQLVTRPAYEEPSVTAIVTQIVVGLGFMIGGTLWLWLWRTNADRKVDDLAAAVHNLSALALGLWAGGVRTVRSGQDLKDMAQLTGAHHNLSRQQRRRQIHDLQQQMHYGAAAGQREHTRPPVVVVVNGNGDPARSSSAKTGPLPALRGLPPAGATSNHAVSMDALCKAMYGMFRQMIDTKDIYWRADQHANPAGKALFIDNNVINVVMGRVDLLQLSLNVGNQQISCGSCFAQAKQARKIVMRALRREVTANGATGAFWSEGVVQGWSRKLDSELLQLQNQP